MIVNVDTFFHMNYLFYTSYSLPVTILLMNNLNYILFIFVVYYTFIDNIGLKIQLLLLLLLNARII
jgi:hypothetical protein